MSEHPSSTDRFYVGELVDWLDPGDDHPEVTICSPLVWIEWIATEPLYFDADVKEGHGWGYAVAYKDGDTGVELEINLRRKPFPLDPDKIDRPEELTA